VGNAKEAMFKKKEIRTILKKKKKNKSEKRKNAGGPGNGIEEEVHWEKGSKKRGGWEESWWKTLALGSQRKMGLMRRAQNSDKIAGSTKWKRESGVRVVKGGKDVRILALEMLR